MVELIALSDTKAREELVQPTKDNPEVHHEGV